VNNLVYIFVRQSLLCHMSAQPDWTVKQLSNYWRDKNCKKSQSLPSSPIFQPFVLETLGPINSSGISFCNKLGWRLTDVSRDLGETVYLFLWGSLWWSCITIL